MVLLFSFIIWLHRLLRQFKLNAWQFWMFYYDLKSSLDFRKIVIESCDNHASFIQDLNLEQCNCFWECRATIADIFLLPSSFISCKFYFVSAKTNKIVDWIVWKALSRSLPLHRKASYPRELRAFVNWTI